MNSRNAMLRSFLRILQTENTKSTKNTKEETSFSTKIRESYVGKTGLEDDNRNIDFGAET
jgi:hypothetical protein